VNEKSPASFSSAAPGARKSTGACAGSANAAAKVKLAASGNK
jgi:hypothetical protein